MSHRPAGFVSLQGNYAGSASRFAAYVIDLAVSTCVFALGLAVTTFGVQIVTRHSVTWNMSNVVVAVVFVAWQFFYFGYCWAASGRTLGMPWWAYAWSGRMARPSTRGGELCVPRCSRSAS